MTRDIRLAVGYVCAIAALGAFINAAAIVMKAKGADRSVGVHRTFSDPRPSRWCGWWLRQKLGVKDRRYNLARAWAGLGRAATPAPGVVVVWRGHVGLIVRVTGQGKAVVKSGNDGGRVRERERSIRNAIAFRQVGA
jgi:hypothetical protein